MHENLGRPGQSYAKRDCNIPQTLYLVERGLLLSPKTLPLYGPLSNLILHHDRHKNRITAIISASLCTGGAHVKA